jgi:hypothetical protein
LGAAPGQGGTVRGVAAEVPASAAALSRPTSRATLAKDWLRKIELFLVKSSLFQKKVYFFWKKVYFF